jgi:Antibiotic biosynthesis monooxygenase
MFIAMNRFRVKPGSEPDFEAVWLNREVYLDAVPGFVEFHLLRGPKNDDIRCTLAHDLAQPGRLRGLDPIGGLRNAHKDAGGNKPLYLGHPQFEGFEVCRPCWPSPPEGRRAQRRRWRQGLAPWPDGKPRRVRSAIFRRLVDAGLFPICGTKTAEDLTWPSPRRSERASSPS